MKLILPSILLMLAIEVLGSGCAAFNDETSKSGWNGWYPPVEGTHDPPPILGLPYR